MLAAASSSAAPLLTNLPSATIRMMRSSRNACGYHIREVVCGLEEVCCYLKVDKAAWLHACGILLTNLRLSNKL
jgi:hypothetical protein